ncbi:hypothetical protein H2509_02415 [Stappia sp. F7233]|uniref:Uncharacterized protein n=1 Tax=Stappia albiluteola TaxID=2758565 RepID=A0A839AAP6_9HYPH|nr:hypothetical protein [Stappia albiluteola]MBA5775977.1 hypothetical protein [Stappia albiluteola]
MLEMWKARRARKAAVATILPLVERSRFRSGQFSDSHWLDAYMVGFLVMLITLVAQRRVHSLGSDTLGNVQADAWQEITGLPGNIVGEEACLLSATGHRDFERGCENASKLMNAIISGAERHPSSEESGNLGGAIYDDDASAALPPGLGDTEHDRNLQSMWREFFEGPMTLSPIQAADRDRQ